MGLSPDQIWAGMARRRAKLGIAEKLRNQLKERGRRYKPDQRPYSGRSGKRKGAGGRELDGADQFGLHPRRARPRGSIGSKH